MTFDPGDGVSIFPLAFLRCNTQKFFVGTNSSQVKMPMRKDSKSIIRARIFREVRRVS